ncbi:MAG: aldehyde dehydrogenase family protein, partial [Acidimicrobiales bacterium]
MSDLRDGLDRNLIDGRLVASSNGATFETLNPATEDVLGVAADATVADVDAAIAAARRAFDDDVEGWTTDVAFRARCLRQLKEAMLNHSEELRELTIAEVGAPRFLTTLAQLDSPVEDLGYIADLAENYEGWSQDLGVASPAGVPSHRWVLREPAGVVGAVTPWNFPHQINLAKVGPALAAGCTVILKPAPDTPWAAAALAHLAATETDIPPGVLNVVNSSDHALGAMLSSDPRVDLVSFTGSTATGRKVMAAASETLKRVFLELGGKSAFIILDDADIASAASLAAFTACTHAGQGCAITTRLLVPRTRHDEIVEVAAATMAALGAGDPNDPGTICGPLISARQRDRVE